MAYTYNIPNAGDQLSVSQGQIKNNFIALGAIAGNSPTNGSQSLNSAPGIGFNFVNLANQGASIPSTSTNNYIYSAVSTTTDLPEVYINYNAGTDQTLVTGSVLGNTPAPASLANGWTSLPSGIILKWGTAACTSATSFTFPATDAGGNDIPEFTQVLNLQLTVRVGPGGGITPVVTAFSVTPTTFTPAIVGITNNVNWTPPTATTANLSYFAIGYSSSVI
jgi:hypothetical protein